MGNEADIASLKRQLADAKSNKAYCKNQQTKYQKKVESVEKAVTQLKKLQGDYFTVGNSAYRIMSKGVGGGIKYDICDIDKGVAWRGYTKDVFDKQLLDMKTNDAKNFYDSFSNIINELEAINGRYSLWSYYHYPVGSFKYELAKTTSDYNYFVNEVKRLEKEIDKLENPSLIDKLSNLITGGSFGGGGWGSR